MDTTLRKQIFDSRNGDAVLAAVEHFFVTYHILDASAPEAELVASSYPFRG
jgi:tRNA-dihydrouridine synthase B